VKSPKPKNETKRIKVLWQYDVLDTVPEAVFDELADLAALICGAPIAMISLVDKDRQWFKSAIGVKMKQTSRDISFCAHAIMQTDLFVVPDATRDKRFKANPLVRSHPKIRFYAGAPLITPDGHALGALCVIDQVPRQLKPEQKKALTVLARHVMTQLELRRRTHKPAAQDDSRDETKSELGRAHAEIERLRSELNQCQSAMARRRT
jgi:GAF domain-containing protein